MEQNMKINYEGDSNQIEWTGKFTKGKCDNKGMKLEFTSVRELNFFLMTWTIWKTQN